MSNRKLLQDSSVAYAPLGGWPDPMIANMGIPLLQYRLQVARYKSSSKDFVFPPTAEYGYVRTFVIFFSDMAYSEHRSPKRDSCHGGWNTYFYDWYNSIILCIMWMLQTFL